MGCNHHTPNPSSDNTLTRRKALAGTASVACTVSALAVGAAIGNALPKRACAGELPGGAAVATTPKPDFLVLDTDPGLAALEAGYRKWQRMSATEAGCTGGAMTHLDGPHRSMMLLSTRSLSGRPS